MKRTSRIRNNNKHGGKNNNNHISLSSRKLFSSFTTRRNSKGSSSSSFSASSKSFRLLLMSNHKDSSRLSASEEFWHDSNFRVSSAVESSCDNESMAAAAAAAALAVNTSWEDLMAIDTDAEANTDASIISVGQTPYLYSQQHEIQLKKVQELEDTRRQRRQQAKPESEPETLVRQLEWQWHYGCTQTYGADDYDADKEELPDRGGALSRLKSSFLAARDLGISSRAVKEQQDNDNKTPPPKYSLKRLNANANPEQTRSFQLEALYLSILHHPNLIHLHAVSASTSPTQSGGGGGGIFVLTDFVPETLQDRIRLFRKQAAMKRNPKSRNTTAKMKNDCYPEDLLALKTNYALQIADALQYLHDRGIVVRTLSPATIGFLGSGINGNGKSRNHHTIQLLDLSNAKEVCIQTGSLASDCWVAQNSDKEEADRNSVFGASIGGDMDDSASFDEDAAMAYLTSPVSLRRRLSSDGGSFANSTTNQYEIQFRAPELYCQQQQDKDNNSSNNNKHGNTYNTKADVYSWSMISFYLLTDTLPFGKRQLTEQEHLHRVKTHGIRPNLKKKDYRNIPRSIQAILEHAWESDHGKKRWSSHQIQNAMSSVLYMLEGRGLPWNHNHNPTTAIAATMPSSTKSSNNNNGQPLSTSNGNGNKTNSVVVPQTLPERAAQLVKHAKKQKKQKQQANNPLVEEADPTTSWSHVWDIPTNAKKKSIHIDMTDIDCSRGRVRRRQQTQLPNQSP